MMNKYLQKNLEAIRMNHPEIKINDELVAEYEIKTKVEQINAYNGYNLCSTIDKNQSIEVWCEQFQELKHNEVIFAFGIGNLDYYVRLRELYPTQKMIIYEPLEDIFYNNIAVKDYMDFLLQDGVYICTGEFMNAKFDTLCEETLGYDSINKPYFVQIPNYNKIIESEYDIYIDVIANKLKGAQLSNNTFISFEEDFIDNYLDNLKVLPREATMEELIRCFCESAVDNYPAIILAAGPSLDKNICKLRDIKGRALVIAVDAAVNTATTNGIRPDLIVTEDPHAEPKSLKDSMGREIPLAIRIQGSSAIRDASIARKFFLSIIDHYLWGILKGFNKTIPVVETGGSVANTAFSIAKMLGFNTIILMGQDLGFPNNKQHAIDAFGEEEEMSDEDEHNFYVEGVDGKKVLTSIQMDLYRGWFEDAIRKDSSCNVIDATEGGALIHGTKVMTIEEAIDEYCPQDRIDFEKLINSADYLTIGEDRDRLEQTINKTFEDVDNNIAHLETIKRDYYKLREVNEKRKYNSSEFKKLIKKIGEHNNYIENNRDFALYQRCCAKRSVELTEALKDVYDDEYENIKNLVTQGLGMLDDYIRAGKMLKEKWNKINGKGEGN